MIKVVLLPCPISTVQKQGALANVASTTQQINAESLGVKTPLSSHRRKSAANLADTRPVPLENVLQTFPDRFAIASSASPFQFF